jgi:hypothetical protein
VIESLQSYLNKGLVTRCEDAVLQNPQKTLLVLGIARGGTSAVAGALAQLGVFMGDLSAGPVFEDVHLSSKIESGTDQEIQELIADYNHCHDVWAYKRPRLLYHIDHVHQFFRNPVYIVVFRDIFAAAQRTRISGGVDTLTSMKKLLGDSERILSFIDTNRPSFIMVSYEKLLAYPMEFVEQLAEIAGLSVSSAQLQAAADFVRPAPPDYLDATRTNKAAGAVSLVAHDVVTGWARYLYPLKPKAVVSLRLNGEIIATTTAELEAIDLPEVGDMPAGTACGYRFCLPGNSIKAGDLVSVRATDEIVDLPGSPQRAFTAG